MSAPTTQWDRPATDAELASFNGTEKTGRVRAEIMETLTVSVRKVSPLSLSVPYVKHSLGSSRIGQYAVIEVVRDYSRENGPEAALLALYERSDCPLVAEYRKALATAYADAWADEVELLIDGEK